MYQFGNISAKLILLRNNLFMSFQTNHSYLDYLHFVLEVYITSHYLLVPFLILVGAAGLAYSYGVCAEIYGKKHMDKSKYLTNKEFKKEALLYSYFRCNLTYLGLYVLSMWLITFRRLSLFVIFSSSFLFNSQHIFLCIC